MNYCKECGSHEIDKCPDCPEDLIYVYVLMERFSGETRVEGITSDKVRAEEWENQNDCCVRWSDKVEIK